MFFLNIVTICIVYANLGLAQTRDIFVKDIGEVGQLLTTKAHTNGQQCSHVLDYISYVPRRLAPT